MRLCEGITTVPGLEVIIAQVGYLKRERESLIGSMNWVKVDSFLQVSN